MLLEEERKRGNKKKESEFVLTIAVKIKPPCKIYKKLYELVC